MPRIPRAKRPGVKALFPGFIEPALATALGRPPKGGEWIHEVKFDGYRVQVHIANEAVKVFTRRGHDWTERFSKIAADAWRLNARSAIIDGEVIVHAADGTSDFAVLQKEIRAKRSSKLVMYAFDLLYLDGNDMRTVPLADRKDMLARLIKGSDIQLSRSFEADGAAMFKASCEMGLEGIVSKRAASRYRSGRTSDWLKMTCRQRETLRIAGYALKEGRFDGLYLGRDVAGKLTYAGKVDHGFSRDNVSELLARMKPLVQRTQAYAEKIQKAKAVWLKPVLLVEVEYRAKSEKGKVRHPSFKGLRDDLV